MQFHEALKQAVDKGLKIRKTCWVPDQYLEYDTSRKTLVTKSKVPTCSTIEDCMNADWEVLVTKRVTFGQLPTGTKFKFDDTPFHATLTKVPEHNAINKTTTQTLKIEDERLVVVVE